MPNNPNALKLVMEITDRLMPNPILFRSNQASTGSSNIARKRASARGMSSPDKIESKYATRTAKKNHNTVLMLLKSFSTDMGI